MPVLAVTVGADKLELVLDIHYSGGRGASLVVDDCVVVAPCSSSYWN
jgi:hypothetical protein